MGRNILPPQPTPDLEDILEVVDKLLDLFR